jgi:hypothetical protein
MFAHSVRFAIVLALGAMVTMARAEEPKVESLKRALLQNAPEVIRYLKNNNCKNVGVLKFRVKIGDAKATDSAGPINMAVANELEIALALSRANDPKNPIGIVRRASEVAATIPGATHLTKDGRQKFFTKSYPLAWGKESVTPDIFLTGVVQVDADLSAMWVNIGAFANKADGKLEKVVDFRVSCDPALLADSGQSFLVRGLADNGKVVQTAVQTAAKVKGGELKHPWDDQPPIKLDIRYNGKSIPVKVENGKARVAEPREGDKVTFVLSRNDNSQERYGVVLKVNGENTLYKQRLSPELCTKWIFDPGAEPYTVVGFKTKETKGERFRVLSRAESKESEVYYGADVGTIELVVFREKKVKEEPKLLLDDDEDMALIHRGILPDEPPANLGALRTQLRQDLKRGVIGSGEAVDIETNKVKFDTDPTPVMAVTIVYYKP